MPRKVLVDDLIDARDVAEILGLSHRNTVSQYQSRYPDMPRPVVNLGPGRPMLWLRPQIERWHTKTVAEGRTRIGRRPSRSRTTTAPRATGKRKVKNWVSGCSRTWAAKTADFATGLDARREVGRTATVSFG